MAEASRRTKGGSWIRALPNEHGFWVMLSATVLSAELRADFVGLALATGTLVVAAAVASASLFHRKIRSHEGAQLAATAGLGIAGAPIEWAAGLPPSAVLSGSLARLAIFLASSFLVRAAFARSSRKPGVSSSNWQRAALLLLGTAFAALILANRLVEARACVLAALVCVVLIWWGPTAKQLKPLGLSLAGLALGSAVALAL
jgi:hypothetical protein